MPVTYEKHRLLWDLVTVVAADNNSENKKELKLIFLFVT